MIPHSPYGPKSSTSSAEAMLDRFYASKQVAVKLQLAFSCLFPRDNPSPDPTPGCFSSYINQHPYPALRLLTQNKDTVTLARLLTSPWFDTGICTRFLEAEDTDHGPCRLLLGNPSLAPQVLTSSGTTTWISQIRKWTFQLGQEQPLLRLAMSTWTPVEDSKRKSPGTDGSVIFCPTDGPVNFPYSSFLHMTLHCLFSHHHPTGDYSPELWDLSCDLHAEHLMHDYFPDHALTFPEELIHRFPEGLLDLGPGAIASHIRKHWSKEEQITASQRVKKDDHSLWYHTISIDSRPLATADSGGGTQGEGNESAGDTLRKHSERSTSPGPHWDGLISRLSKNRSRRRRFGLAPGSRQDKLLLREEGRYDFSRYLKRFSVTREEMQLDPDSFDYIPYYYGTQLDDRMPFFEPLEYTVARKVEELVIAIDTSGSCSLPIVQRFLAEIQHILLDHDNFFHRMNLRILQCDSMIQADHTIHSMEDWKRYVKDITIEGRGGTDFTPVFRHVEKLRQEGSLRKLRGLLYFTDGDGIYPQTPTEYETAFVFTDNRFTEYDIPSWIYPLCLDLPDSLGRESAKPITF